MKSLESRVVYLERKSGSRMPAITVEVVFIPAVEGHPAPAPYETLLIHIGKPEVAE